jgi:hypothetical protein
VVGSNERNNEISGYVKGDETDRLAERLLTL